jgi:hypothetical protein
LGRTADEVAALRRGLAAEQESLPRDDEASERIALLSRRTRERLQKLGRRDECAPVARLEAAARQELASDGLPDHLESYAETLEATIPVLVGAADTQYALDLADDFVHAARHLALDGPGRRTPLLLNALQLLAGLLRDVGAEEQHHAVMQELRELQSPQPAGNTGTDL